MDVHLDVDCGCCGDACSSQCQYQSGTATLVGFHAYKDPAVPPNAYLIGELGGSSDGYICGPLRWMTNWAYSGQDVWDPVTGVLTHGCVLTVTGAGAKVEAMSFITTPPSSDCRFTAEVTPTSFTTTGTSKCCSTNTYHTGAFTGKMSQPDTESDAEARAKAALTTWSHQTDYSCAGLASFRTARGNTFSWSWTQVQRRGITPDYDATMATQAVYRVVLKWYTTATNADGAVVSEGWVELTHSPGWVGDIYTEWADIPIPDAGLFAYAGECRISLVSAGVPRPPNPEET